ncbi:MAG TPA: helix-turn-helix domain-containing protein [Tepidisphaeraceae bacterium]|nr:helix-turn-helix domain-containing protein [Tepidisphaeraceae bacterium]
MRHLEVRLKSWESRRLRQLRKHAPSARICTRALCLLLSAAGDSAKAIARITGLSPDAVTDIRRRWRRRGLRSLVDRPRCGRPPRISAVYRRELRRALRQGPPAFGYVFTVWSIARLAVHLQKRTGIAIGCDWLRRLVHREGFTVGRPKHTLKGKRDEREYRRAKRRLDGLKKGLCDQAPLTNSGTPTARNSTSCRTWSAAGCPPDGNGR